MFEIDFFYQGCVLSGDILWVNASMALMVTITIAAIGFHPYGAHSCISLHILSDLKTQEVTKKNIRKAESGVTRMGIPSSFRLCMP